MWDNSNLYMYNTINICAKLQVQNNDEYLDFGVKESKWKVEYFWVRAK